MVKNELNPTSPIAIIGEAPGDAELSAGRPFVGPSGSLLFNTLSKHGILREQCSVLNVIQDHPPCNDIRGIDLKPWTQLLKADLARINPNVLLLCGGTALCAALGRKESIDNWRGSVFWSPVFERKCVATFHPARVLREYSTLPLFNLDVRKAVRHSRSAEMPAWRREKYLVSGTLDEYLSRLSKLGDTFAFDIEGSPNLITCISFSDGPENTFSIPFVDQAGRRFWRDEETLLQAISDVLTDRTKTKIGHNILYDIHSLTSLGILVREPIEDTMLLSRTLLPELPVGLDTCTSIWTDYHYYKSERTGSLDWHEFLRYNATDAAVTFEIFRSMTAALKDEGQRAYYSFMRDLLWPALFIQMRGLRVDMVRRRESIEEATREWHRLQALLDTFKPVPLTPDFFLDVATKKRNWLTPKARFSQSIGDIRRLAENLDRLSPDEVARLRILTETHLNTSSPVEIATLLFDKLKVESADHSTDVGNLLLLMQRARVSPLAKTAIYLILRIRAVRKFIEMLSSDIADNGRWYFTVNLAGTETGRPSASRTVRGINPLTAPKHGRLGSLFRPIIVAEPEHFIFEVDLSGADGWTVAAHCARLGDETMLLDYQAGIKPYMVIAAMFLGISLPPNRTELSKLLKTIEVPDWLKFAAKRVQHGTSYGLGPKTGVIQLLKDSWKIYGTPIFVPIETFDRLQKLFLARYPGVVRWHERSLNELNRTGKLRTPNGALRTFFGRRSDPSTLREWLAHEPQMNTAYATYLALHRLWYDPENRPLTVKPILMFYDALIGEFPKEKEEFAVRKLREWFNNPITIAGTEVRISYEGGYGPAWGKVERKI